MTLTMQIKFEKINSNYYNKLKFHQELLLPHVYRFQFKALYLGVFSEDTSFFVSMNGGTWHCRVMGEE
jgi:hypothetical protein